MRLHFEVANGCSAQRPPDQKITDGRQRELWYRRSSYRWLDGYYNKANVYALYPLLTIIVYLEAGLLWSTQTCNQPCVWVNIMIFIGNSKPMLIFVRGVSIKGEGQNPTSL